MSHTPSVWNILVALDLVGQSIFVNPHLNSALQNTFHSLNTAVRGFKCHKYQWQHATRAQLYVKQPTFIKLINPRSKFLSCNYIMAEPNGGLSNASLTQTTQADIVSSTSQEIEPANELEIKWAAEQRELRVSAINEAL
jgi:hypothetical protein